MRIDLPFPQRPCRPQQLNEKDTLYQYSKAGRTARKVAEEIN